MSLTPGFKKFIGIIGFAAVLGGGWYANSHGYFKSKDVAPASVPSIDMTIPTAGANAAGPVSKVDIVPSTGSSPITIQTIAWNATAGLMYANGDVTTSPDSIMAKHGAKVNLSRVDNYDVMVASLAAFAKDLKNGNPNPTNGAPFMIIMGDALPAQIQSINKALAPYGMSGEAIAQIGFSRGEDQCMLPPIAKTNPQAAKGMTVGGVPRDGDLHICFKWAKDNNVPINANAKTYDANALNIMEVDDFTKSDQNFIAGYCENRPVIANGKPTGENHKTCIDGVATWTPGDVTVATKKGGIIGVASTKEYSYQMPSLIIGIKQWMEANRALTENIVGAALEGGEVVLNSDAALAKAGEVEAKVFKQETGAWWNKYYKGMTQADATGMQVRLGGSTVSGLADNAFYFGLNGNDNIFKKVYTVYGAIDKAYYPTDLPEVLQYEKAVNTKYIQALLAKASTMAPAVTPSFSATAPTKSVVSKAIWKIEFETGKATFKPGSQEQLDDLLNQLSAGTMSIEIKGYTDNVGDSTSNLALSAKRAAALKSWLTTNAPSTMVAERIKATGMGGADPVADNTTPQGRSQNRRVEVLQVTK